MANHEEEANYVLYHHLSSICSIMVRYCYALRQLPEQKPEPVRIREQSIDIFHGEQLSEHYLCDINKFGEVPVLAPLPEQPNNTIPDSLIITIYLATHYPSMIPKAYHDEIADLLRELHAINFYSLTFTGKPQTMEGIKKTLHERLDAGVSGRYRDAINKKLAHITDCRSQALEPANVEHNLQLAMLLLHKVKSNLAASKTGWLFGLEVPSALDAHLVVFLVRMKDVGRKKLFTPELETYVAKAVTGEAWRSVQHGSTDPTGGA